MAEVSSGNNTTQIQAPQIQISSRDAIIKASSSSLTPNMKDYLEGKGPAPQGMGNDSNLAQGVLKPPYPGVPASPVISEREMHVVASIEEWNRGLDPAALKAKFRMMGLSPISFFSGTNHLFWADLSGDPHLTKFGNPKTTTWICGNCTYSAFSASGSDADGPLYGLDNFDESLVADYQYDIWRLAASIALLARDRMSTFPLQSKTSDATSADALEQLQMSAVKAMAHGYLSALQSFRIQAERGDAKAGFRQGGLELRRGMNSITGLSSSNNSSSGSGSGNGGTGSATTGTEGRAEKLSRLLTLTGGNSKGLLVRFLAVVERECSRRKMIKKWCGDVSNIDVGSTVSFLVKPNSVEPCPQYEADAVVAALGSQYADGVNVKALARRLYVSPSTCGTPRFVALTESPNKELHILDICVHQRPTAYHFMNPGERSAYLGQWRSEAQRFAAACQALSLADERSTGWISLEGSGIHPSAAGFYSVRDLSPFHEEYPVSVQDDVVKTKLKAFCISSKETLLELSETWGRILGTQHSHAASVLEEQQGVPVGAGQQPVFASEVVKLVKEQGGGFEELASQIAVSYSRQVVHDWQVFLRHILSRE